MSRKPFSPEVMKAKREAIFQAARKLLARHDFHDLKMDDIARRAGIAKGSLYTYFKDKDSLYSGLVQSLFDKLIQRASGLLGSGADPRDLLRDILVSHAAFFEEHIDVFTHFFREGPGASSRDNSHKIRFRDHINNIAAVIQKGITNGQFREVDPVKASFILMGMIRSAVLERIHGFTHDPLGKDIGAIWDIYMKGIGR